MNVKSMKRNAGHLSLRLLFWLAVAACLILGVVGLILPIIPGLLFLAIAALMLAPHIPALNDWLRRSPLMSRYVEDVEGLRSLQTGDQLKLGALLSLRMFIDGLKFLAKAITGQFDDFGRHHLRRGGSRRGQYDMSW
jgi:uncharacterized membrane protein YbaN (DUF454 family)